MNSSGGHTGRALAGGFDFRVHSTSGKLSQEDGRERLNGLRYESDEPRERAASALVKLSSKHSWIALPSRRFFLRAWFASKLLSLFSEGYVHTWNKSKKRVSFSFDLIGIVIFRIYIYHDWFLKYTYIYIFEIKMVLFMNGKFINENNIIYCNTIGSFSHILGIYIKKSIQYLCAYIWQDFKFTIIWTISIHSFDSNIYNFVHIIFI